jgi:hypothetical protein
MRIESMNANLIPLLAAALLVGASGAGAATILFDFETEADLEAMHDEGQTGLGAGKTLERVERFATSGRFALKFTTPRYEPGRPQWPAFECRPPLANWTGFDRLVMDVTSASDAPQTLSLFISDTKVPTRNGLAFTARLAPGSFSQVVIPLSQLAEKQVNPADIHVIHFFTSEPPSGLTLYLDRLVLLKPGEPVSAVSDAFLKDFAALAAEKVAALRASLAGARARATALVAGWTALESWADREFGDLESRAAKLSDTVSRAGAEVLEADHDVASLQAELARLESLTRFRAAFAQFRREVQAGPEPRADVAVGFATSMEKILPRGAPISVTATNRLEVSLARNEKGSFQVLVLPCDRPLRDVRVRAGNLASAGGAEFLSTHITAAPVGYVRTRSTPPYGSSHVGWWPDPILDFMDSAPIAKGDLQSFWVRLRAPKDQPPGLYQGKLEVLVDGAPAFAFDLSVTVFPFTLPDRSPLPLAITFSPEDSPLPATQKQQEAWRRSPDYPLNAWKKHKLRWADFLADYYITYDSLYHHGVPDTEVLTHLRDQGRLGMYNLGYYDHVQTNPAAIAAWKTAELPRFRQAYADARALGLLKHAYIYGCDEAAAELFPLVQTAGRILKTEFPDVLVMTTTYDQSYGLQSVITAMDAFCPLTPSFDPAKAARARQAGKQVWWYICCGPHHPHANMFIEYPAIEGRLIMGAMTAKYRPDGFLYYQISIWNSEKPITSGPFTDWDPRSWTTYHGDGSWTCAGPDGTPLPTIRLENFRDGLEDYAYARLLDSAVATVEAAPELRAAHADWLAQAKARLEVPADVLKNKTEYTHDPAALYRWRDGLAAALLSSPAPPVQTRASN